MSKSIKRISPYVKAIVAAALTVSIFHSSNGQSTAVNERAYQDREILYELQAPESHAFRITHDYTVRKESEQYYFNIVRAGSHVTDPESIDLDSGEKLKWEIISGKEARERKLIDLEFDAKSGGYIITRVAAA